MHVSHTQILITDQTRASPCTTTEYYDDTYDTTIQKSNLVYIDNYNKLPYNHNRIVQIKQ